VKPTLRGDYEQVLRKRLEKNLAAMLKSVSGAEGFSMAQRIERLPASAWKRLDDRHSKSVRGAARTG
jgi:hypothetical protein